MNPSVDTDEIGSPVRVPVVYKSPQTKKRPPSKTIQGVTPKTQTMRHNPEANLEPKVYAPHETRPGQVPRRIEVERKKRTFASVDITEILNEKKITAFYEQKEVLKKHSGDLQPHFFDNSDFESRTMEEWIRLVQESPKGLPSRSLRGDAKGNYSWKPGMVKGWDPVNEEFLVVFDAITSEYAVQQAEQNEEDLKKYLNRMFICFDAEDPIEYCKRMEDAVTREKLVKEELALNLYADCMPVDNLKPLDSEQVNRILDNALNVEKMKANESLDTISLIQQYNLSHMRTLNKMVLVRTIQDRTSDVQLVQSKSINAQLLMDTWHFPNGDNMKDFPHGFAFEESRKQFKFNSLLNKSEAISIVSHVQKDNYNIKKGCFFLVPEKTVRCEEYTLTQQNALSNSANQIKDIWLNSVTSSVRRYLKDVKKGWYNIEESNVEVYQFSKLRKFLYRINFMMEDTVRDFLIKNLHDYVSSIDRCCPSKIDVVRNDLVNVECERFPLLTVDLKFNEPVFTEGKDRELKTPASFTYANSPESFATALLQPFDQVFDMLKGIIKVERRVMKNLFWSHDPIMRVPHAAEDWVIDHRNHLLDLIKKSILDPMENYLQTLHPFVDLISLDVADYVKAQEAKFCPDGGTMDLVGLCNLAKSHDADAETVFNAFPSTISLGIILIDLKALKKMLSNKHTTIAARIFEVQNKHMRLFAEEIQNEFNKMFRGFSQNPKDIEHLSELRDYMQTVPGLVNEMMPKIEANDMHYKLLSDAKYRLQRDDMDIQWEVVGWPLKISEELENQEKLFRVLEAQYKAEMNEEQNEFAHHLSSLQSEVNRLKDLTKLEAAPENAKTVRRIRKDLKAAAEKAQLFVSRESLFGVDELTEYTEINEITKVFDPFHDLWDSAEKWITNKEVWTNGLFADLDADSLESSVGTLLRNLTKCGKTFDRLNLSKCNCIAESVRDEVGEFRPRVPLISALRNPGMRERHWSELQEKLNVTFQVPIEDLTLQMLVDEKLLDNLEVVQKIAEKAGKEFGIEKALDKMQSAWETVELVIEPYRDTGSYILKAIDEYMALLDEHITMTQAMAFSAFKGPFEERIDNWNNSLQVVSEVVDEWTVLQRNWLYLQPIFDSPDINKQLPQEGKRFATVDKYWKQTMVSAAKGVLAIKFCDDSRLLDRFREGNKLLEMVQKGLADYLETKRAGFSRFYFLSNDELLEILSETKDPLRVQPHLRKCFEGIKTVDFQDDLTITGMTSPEGEKVPFVKPVDPKGKNIEHWMVEVCNAMMDGVKDNMIDALIDYSETPRTEWMQKWAAQCVLNGSQYHWTREVEASMHEAGNAGVFKYYDQLVQQLADMVILIRGKISKLGRVTIGSLAVIDVHARDQQKKMAEGGISSVTDFDWISQMRYYWGGGELKDRNGTLEVIMVSSKRLYGFEYLGNTFRLVITPLTDKCYLTLMGALQMILGGAPAGPAGTGKTETTKDLAKALAKQCVVFNCSDGLDYMAMGKFFKGLASAGAWACFDEFNRINIEVLSVIAQQVIQLQGTVQRGEKRTIFEGTDINVDPEFAVYITMNPGYAGRAELPDNLEALFRPVAMMVPDYALIGEIMLFSYGYMENRKCALKMVATFRLCSEQLSSQDHYDYGMRAVKTVITAAGNLKRASPDENEEALLMRALQDVNVPKFLAHDLPLFAGILSDLFPGIKRPDFDYGPLLVALNDSILKNNLQPIEVFRLKNIELYEMICVRHGLMVVGPTGGGKSSNIKVLSQALTKLKADGVEGIKYEKTRIYHLNPKAIKMGQLYGEFDENTHEWQDGILCVLIRKCIKEDNSNLKWMLFDGPVDALWIENMNTVLDDNKKLCLTSGEIIQLSEPMTMMFEPEDLAVASPATVSRCGMVYMEPTSLGYDVLLQSWLNLIPPCFPKTLKGKLQELFDKFIPSVLGFLRRYATEPLPTVNNCLVAALFNLLDTFLVEFRHRDDGSEDKSPEEIATFINNIDPLFLFCMTWSMACTVNSKGRHMMDSFIREEVFSFGVQNAFPADGTIFDFKFDPVEGVWINWIDTAKPFHYDPKLSFSELIVPTQDSVCYTYLFDILVRNRMHTLMTGPTGTGKTVNIQMHLQSGLPQKYVPITLSFSAQTSANQTQDLIDSKCEKRRKGVFGPTAGKEFVIFVDDINMPMKEEYGAQPPIEILRQWFDNNGWYDRSALEMRKIIDVIFVASCGPPGGGRNDVTPRFYRHFNIINYVDLSNNSLNMIFNSILSNFLSNFDSSIQDLSSGIVGASISIFNTILKELRPTPAKPHYVFNLRDIAKVFQGMLMIDKRKVSGTTQFARVWVHEFTRVFGDRLINDTDKSWLMETISKAFTKMFSETEDISWPNLWSERDFVVYTDFMVPGADPTVYEEATDISTLQAQVEEYLGDYNGESKQPMHLVLFNDALMHVVKISRILRQPSGHALLLGVGGSGRQSLTRLSSFISGYRCYQVEIAKGYGMNEWRENVKEVLLYAGAQNLPIVFLFNDTQIINETMLEDINGILNSGDVPNLYAPEDLETISTACRPECQKKKIPPTKLNIFAQFLSRVKSNTHVVLCMSPLGSAFRTRLRMFPSIVNCCTIDWFMEWPDEALQSVAGRFLQTSELGLQNGEAVVNYFQFLHQSIEKSSVEFLTQMRRHFYVTPTSYLELLSTYERVLQEKRKEVGTLRDRLKIGVEKLISTETQVNELQAQLTEMEPVLIKTQAEVEEMIVQITADKATAAQTKAVVQVEEAAAAKKAAETKAIADDAQKDLDEALPALAMAVQCLKDLKKADIDEVKSLGRPPQNVIKTLQACCVMFAIKPERINDPDNPGKKINDYFKAAQKNLLSNANKLLDDMQNYDKDNIPPEIIEKIEPFYNDPTFTPEIIEKASKACKAMCMWTRAMYKYHQVVLMVEPKKKLLAEAQESLDETMGVLEVAQKTLAEAEANIANLEASFNAANEKKEQLVIDVTQCRERLERAVKLMSGLGSEKTRWTESCTNLTAAYDNLVGDALVSAGAISYLGVFTPDFRHKIFDSWQKKLAEYGIPHSLNCNLQVTMADPVAIRQWTIFGLPQDSHSVENGIIMSKGRRYPLLIDPQGQANRFIKNMGKDTSVCPNDLDVVKLSDKNFLRTLENGVRFGRWVLLENIGETLDAALEPLLLQQKFKQGGTEMIKIGDSTIPWNDSFKFYMTTKYTNPHYAPEVCVKVSIVNFAITFSGLDDQLLGVVVVEEMPEMEEKKNSLVVSNARMRKELQEIEDLILFMLSNSTGNILDDHKLIETLANSKVKSSEITAKVQEAERTEEQIDISRNMYKPVAFRGAVLYFCIADLATIDPMYQYSLQWFRNLFIQAIRLAEKSDDIGTRIGNLNDYFTYYVYTNICRSLFEKHKLIFSFLLTIRILQGNKAIDPMEWMFFISGKGLKVQDMPNPASDWIDGRMWAEIVGLSTLPQFPQLATDISMQTNAWRRLYDSSEPHVMELPGVYAAKDSFQKLCILRCFRPDKIRDGVMHYVIDQLGQKFVEPPPFDLHACFKDSNVLSPLVFVLSKGSDPGKSVLEFAAKMKMDKKIKMLSLGQGQGPKACKMIEEATQKGAWVFLQNCHLFISWLQTLERICENFTVDSVHKDFRLWLTSMPCPQFPVSVLQSSVKMTNEPPKGMKANLRNAYFKLNNNMLDITRSPSIYKKLLFGLCFFHAVVQERRQFGPLGWNIPYEFNDTDLDISRGQLQLFLDQYDEIPWKVLNFLTSYINYGGRVTDYIDLRSIDVIMISFYNPKILSPDYKFDAEGIFYSIEPDEEDPHASYMNYIDGLPMVAPPSVFGMHDNASIASANAEAFMMFDTCLSLQASDAGSGGPSREELLEGVVNDINSRISAVGLFDIEGIGMRYPVVYEQSMNTVLIQECIRYNKLLDALLTDLPLLSKALKGLVVMSSDLEAISTSIAMNQVAAAWASKAYPSLKPLAAWVDDLLLRLQFINDWIENGVPTVFWISGFYFPQAFLTGSLQNFARKYKYPIDTVSFDFVLVKKSYDKIASPPEDGVYIRGLFLEGARWSTEENTLTDSLPKQLYTELPTIHLLPIKDREDKTEGIYRCPVYKILSRRGTLSTTGHSTNFIFWIELPSNRTNITNNVGLCDQEEWIRAGVAAFSSLMY